MRLVADRFAFDEGEDEHGVDLATGARVVVCVGSAGGVSDQLQWTLRCDTFGSLQHHAIAPLLDWGIVGESSRFEAWLCGSAWRGSPEEARPVREIARQFLQASGLSAGDPATECMRTGRNGRVVLLPDAGTGYSQDTDEHAAETAPMRIRGLSIIDRRAVSALAEMFHAAGGVRPHISAVWGPPGSGRGMVVRELARIARTNGFVPVASRLIDSRYAGLLRGRSLFVIADGDDAGGATPWSAPLDAALSAPQPHVFLMVGEVECRSVDGVALGRVPADALVAAIRPRALSVRRERAVRGAAVRAQGLPGRFARILWTGGLAPGRPPSRLRRLGEAGCGLDRDWSEPRPNVTMRLTGLSRVAEQPAAYGHEDPVSDFVSPPSPGTWPAPGELTALRRKTESALVHLAHGRHAPGIRQLRQAIGGLARRNDWIEAGDGALALAGALLRRGRPRDAQATIEEGRQYATRAGRESMLIDLATLSGEAWIDQARLDEAESVLGTALAAARAERDPTRVAASSIALARCLYWRGQFGDAEAALGSLPDAAPPAMRVRHVLLASRIAVGRRDFTRAMSLAMEAGQRARTDGETLTTAAAECTAAFVHLAVGDLDAVERDVPASIAAARAAHDPLRAIRAQLLRIEAEGRRGRSSAALAHLRRLRRVMSTVPPALRARWELSTALAAEGAEPRDVVARHVAATGLGALALYAGDRRIASAPSGAADPFADEVVAILRVCQTADEEAVLLKDVCARVRQHLHAAAVAFVAIRGDRSEIVTGDGARLDTSIAERAATAGMTISPHRHDERIEAAAPVQYGGAPIGALCARWTLGSTYDTSRASWVLTMSAAAAAPMLSAALAKRAQGVAAGASELLGIAPAMIELRQSVERAAAAPFSVLIDGESGSGKELVARAIHRGGPRRHRMFCTLNCAALPEDLVEAELFGHARGAFTGAMAERAGVFEEANGGTLFLDEIGELSTRAQAKVLRVVQEGELRRVGENVSRRIDVRIVAATNRDLRREVERDRFRLDLLYRLDVVHITVPALRDRREDIGVLAEYFWRDAAARVGSRATLGAATLAALARYDWPGNVRELQNVLAALAVRSPKRGVVPPSALPSPFVEGGRGDVCRLDDARRTFEERFVRAALVRTGGHRGRAAAELGVTRQGLTKLLTRLGISSSAL